MTGEIKIAVEISASPALAALIRALADALTGRAAFVAPGDAPVGTETKIPDGFVVVGQSAADAKPEQRHYESRRWTPDRIMQMAFMRAEKAPWTEVLQAVNALPGDPIASPAACETAYYNFKANGKLPKITVEPPRVSDALLAMDARHADTVPVRWTDALRWAVNNGIDTKLGTDDEVFDRINAAREKFHLPPFVVTETAVLENFPPIELPRRRGAGLRG